MLSLHAVVVDGQRDTATGIVAPHLADVEIIACPSIVDMPLGIVEMPLAAVPGGPQGEIARSGIAENAARTGRADVVGTFCRNRSLIGFCRNRHLIGSGRALIDIVERDFALVED